MPSIDCCREILLATATDGKEEAGYIGDFLLKATDKISSQIVYGLITNINNYNSDLPIEKIKGAISMFYVICEDGNFGPYHSKLIQLYLYLSRLQWERGYKDDAFESLDSALEQAKKLDELCDGKVHKYKSALLSLVEYNTSTNTNSVKSLPEDWPAWCVPNYGNVAMEIKSDPRWDAWVEKTKQ